VRSHYEAALSTGGDRGQVVGWRDEQAQTVRFDAIWRLISDVRAVVIADLGCGTGELLRYLREKMWDGLYLGTDISELMLDAARVGFRDDAKARFFAGSEPQQSDIAVMSGLFNVSFETGASSWMDYCVGVLDAMWSSAGLGIVFNMLSMNSDPLRRRQGLAYFDPGETIAMVANRYAANVRLDQSYGQFDFTVAVFRTPIG